MIRKFFFLILILSGFYGHTQETLLKGKIMTEDMEGSSINIINLTSQFGTTNSSTGEFEIPVSLRDTLYFSSVQYEPREIVVTNDLLKRAFLMVLLVEKMNELDEISISNISLSGNLATDIDNIPTLTQADLGFPMSDVPRPTSIERKLITASNVSTTSKENPPGLFNVSLDGILNRINGKTEKLQKAAANEDLSQIVDAGVAAMPVTFFADLSIPENRIRDFVYYCAQTANLAGLLPENKLFELIELYQKKAPQFVKEHL